MTLRRRDDLEPPPAALDGLSDSERKIASRRPVFALADVKSHVMTASISGLNLATRSASDCLHEELRWRLRDVCNFISCLEKHHYRYSEWCRGSGIGASIIYPADVYIMGFNRMKGVEWPQQNPWNYFKFSFSADNNTIEIFSIHPERTK